MTGPQPPQLESDSFDAIIIGAGINGAGIARDAALRGLRVLLLDKGDIGGGTTSWSTRLIHGGLRYLEHGEIGLVRESLRERELLLRNAPHLVRPLPMLIPIYQGRGRGHWTIRAGMLAYDLLSYDKSVARHRMLSHAEALLRAPGLNPAGLHSAALYHDAQVEYAERLVLENVLDARANGARVLTYARVEKLIVEEGRVRGVEFRDASGQESYALSSVVLNVAGPWVDQLLRDGFKGSLPRLVGGTKGSHLIVSPFEGAPAYALYAEALEDRRPFFIVPWNSLYLIGTTDVRYEGDLDHISADEDEIGYLLRETNRLIPSARLTRADILYTYSGVRPLPFEHERDESGITRQHFIRDHGPELEGLLSVIGGKLTTYRNLSEQAVDLIFKKLNRRAPSCLTARRPLPGATMDDATTLSPDFKMKSGLPPPTAERLLRVYGARASEVLEIAGRADDLRESFSPLTCAIGAEIVMSFERELAQTLSDCLLRRTLVGLNAANGLDAVEAAASVAVRHLGWTSERAAQEVSAYRDYIKRFRPRGVALESESEKTGSRA
ncbi:MAG TPA: glycerol-3-phosphate dehydrogenase [Pyrinomonadaceae bacterium]